MAPLSPPPRGVRPPVPEKTEASRPSVSSSSGSLPRPALPPRSALPRSTSQQGSTKEGSTEDIPRSPPGNPFVQKSGPPSLNPFLPERPANPPPLSAAKTSSLRLKAQAAHQVTELAAPLGGDAEDPRAANGSRGSPGLALPKPPPPPPQKPKKISTNPFLSDSDDEEKVEDDDPPEIPFRSRSKSPTQEDTGSLKKTRTEGDKPPVAAPRFYASGGVLPASTDSGKVGSGAELKGATRLSHSSKKNRPPPPPCGTSQQGDNSRDASPARKAEGAPPKVAVVETSFTRTEPVTRKMTSGASAKTTAQVITIDRSRSDSNSTTAHNTSSSNISPWMVADQKKVERKVTLTTEL